MRRARLLLTTAILACQATAEPSAAVLPEEYWWYWDRPASQLPPPPPGVGAAVVVSHVLLSGDRASVVPRRSALPLPTVVDLLPVVHVEVDPARPFSGTAAQRDALRDAIIAAAAGGRALRIQLDFEARQSQRAFWRAAVDAIRARLPTGTQLSVTALASWCHSDDWLADAPVDEIVPMYFRLGRARNDYAARSAAGTTQPRCRYAHGLASDEPPWPVPLPGRRYLFLGTPPHPTPGSLLQRTPP